LKRRPPPGIPPLGDSALARIERGVFSALDERAIRPERAGESRRRLFAFAVAGVAAACAVLGAREWRRGDAPLARATTTATAITTTTSGSHIAISGAALDIAPESAVSFSGGRDGAVVVVLERGAVTCEVAPRSKRAPFVVEAGATRVTVIGTRFSVHRVGGHATVSVDHGLVEVADTNMTELVHAGERYRPGEPVTREPLASEAPPEPPLGPAPAAPAAPTVATVSAPAPTVAAVSAPAPTVATVSAPVLAPPLHSLARPSRHRRLALDDPNEEARSAASRSTVSATLPLPTDLVDGRVPAAATESPAGAARADVAPGVVKAPVEDSRGRAGGPQRSSVQVLFELAAQLEVRDPVVALRIYGELASGEDGWAASALFASARLEAERGHAARARALCEDYLARFPRGPNGDDARALLETSR
jgi:hypothetical protein